MADSGWLPVSSVRRTLRLDQLRNSEANGSPEKCDPAEESENAEAFGQKPSDTDGSNRQQDRD